MVIKSEKQRMILGNEKVKNTIDHLIENMKSYIKVTGGYSYGKHHPDSIRGDLRCDQIHVHYHMLYDNRWHEYSRDDERLTIKQAQQRRKKVLLDYHLTGGVELVNREASLQIDLDNFQTIADVPARIQAVISRISNEQDVLKALIAKKVQ